MHSGTRVRAGQPSARDIARLWNRISVGISGAAILLHILFRYSLHLPARAQSFPLWVAVVCGGVPLLYALVRQALHREFGSDFLAGLSIVTSVAMDELLVATIIVLMLSGGQALEEFATRRASSVLSALARRMPNVAHRIVDGRTQDIPAKDIHIGDQLLILPHEICPVDGTVESGMGRMDESFLTGEPFSIRKIAGSQVISGAINEDSALSIVADKLPVDSRYARIMSVIRTAEESPPRIRRLADRLGALYTPIAIVIALAGWLLSGDPERFLAVIVIATPCPLLLAIPISIIGAISLSAKRGIIIRNPAILEQVGSIETMFFDKTGTLTHGEPSVTAIHCFTEANSDEILGLTASLEQYSKHPLAKAILRAAKDRKIEFRKVESISEKPGAGLTGTIEGRHILVTGRRKLSPDIAAILPPETSGLECVILTNGQLSGLVQFHDRPRSEGKRFIGHLRPKHHVKRLMILSGDRSGEVNHLAAMVGIDDVRANQTPEDKLRIVREETAKGPTLYLGDGVNDAPAMMTATVGIAFGQNSDITAEAAGAVILDPTLGKVDELLHIGRQTRRIALQSAVGGMLLSSIGMIVAASGFLPPLAGAIGQEIIDLLAVLNAVRASVPAKELRDF